MLKLAVYLDLVDKHVKPKPREVFNLADKVIEALSEQDHDYLTHLNVTQQNKVKPHVKVSPRHFERPSNRNGRDRRPTAPDRISRRRCS